MKTKKITAATSALLVGLALATATGCGGGSSDDLHHDNNKTGVWNDSFTGSSFSFIFKGLAQGMLNKVGYDIMGDLFSLLGWGNSGSTDEEKTLKNISAKLSAISTELGTIENTLRDIIKQIDIEEHEIKGDVNWPRDAIDFITTAHQDLNRSAYYYDVNGTLRRHLPGEGNRTKIVNDAHTFIDTYILEDRVTSISEAIHGNDTPLFVNYVGEVSEKLKINDDRLPDQYIGFETYASQLLNNQIMGVNELVEAKKVLESNTSAKLYLDTTYMPMLQREVDDLNVSTSFIYNAFSLVFKNAPLYGQFLPDEATTILQRAEFYRLLVGRKSYDDFGLRFFHIATADTSPATGSVFLYNNDNPIECPGNRYTVSGRAYDFWNGNSVRPSTDYNIVEYNCGAMPVASGENAYTVMTTANPLDSTIWGYVPVYAYDSGYDKNSSGPIAYGFGIYDDDGRTDERFPLNSDKWHTQVPGDDNYHSWHDIHLPGSWSIETKATGGYYESKARVELDGFFTYDGNESTTMYVDYSMQLYVKAHSPFYNSEGGGDAYCYYHIGVYDETDHAIKTVGKDYRLHAGPDHEYTHTNDETGTMSFTAEPGHTYYVYVNLISLVDGPDYVYARTNLNSIDYIRIRFDD